ncbi:hypothetical protein ACQQ2N_17445 [Dokdonella sp. MW10]|uniref:hypothetical protein n=1 Tax=Dokdonella sp. MW10 TaxID=2992926 RepID=UPI003F817BAA
MSEEHPLQGFVHVPLAAQIGLSGFGAVLQISRLNYFRCRDFLAAFGIGYRRSDDLSEVLVRSSKRRDILASVFEAPESLTSLWPVDPWQPFTGTDPWKYVPWRLRACATCLRTGYHSNLFQMPWVTRCPWHREPLIESCKRCGKGLLEQTSGSDLLMQCRCGLDYTSDIAILGGERPDVAGERASCVKTYLAYAAARREAGDLLIPPEEFDKHARDGLRALFGVGTTASGAMPPSEIHLHDCTGRSAASAGPLFTREDIIGTVKNLWPDKPGVAILPLPLWPGLRGVTRNVAKGASAAALSVREREVLELPPAPGARSVHTRAELLLLPARASKVYAFLDTSVLHRSARRAMSNLASQLSPDSSMGASGDTAAEAVVLRALQAGLSRAYADGLKHVLGRHVPAIFDGPRIRSGPRIPWILVKKADGTIQNVRTVWTRRRPWDA